MSYPREISEGIVGEISARVPESILKKPPILSLNESLEEYLIEFLKESRKEYWEK